MQLRGVGTGNRKSHLEAVELVSQHVIFVGQHQDLFLQHGVDIASLLTGLSSGFIILEALVPIVLVLAFVGDEMAASSQCSSIAAGEGQSAADETIVGAACGIRL